MANSPEEASAPTLVKQTCHLSSHRWIPDHPALATTIWQGEYLRQSSFLGKSQDPEGPKCEKRTVKDEEGRTRKRRKGVREPETDLPNKMAFSQFPNSFVTVLPGCGGSKESHSWNRWARDPGHKACTGTLGRGSVPACPLPGGSQPRWAPYSAPLSPPAHRY